MRTLGPHSRGPNIEAPHEPIRVSPLRLTLDDEGLTIDGELIVGARIGDLGRPQLERGRFGMDAGLAKADDRVRAPGDHPHRDRLAARGRVAPFKDWLLPAAIERVRRKLRTAPDGDRQMVDILGAVLTDGLPAVEAACAEALGESVHSADVILNILARQRDPGPPVTIMTPKGLRLRCEPAADCARYDSLRRAAR